MWEREVTEEKQILLFKNVFWFFFQKKFLILIYFLLSDVNKKSFSIFSKLSVGGGGYCTPHFLG